jgi:hypothetical protein
MAYVFWTSGQRESNRFEDIHVSQDAMLYHFSPPRDVRLHGLNDEFHYLGAYLSGILMSNMFYVIIGTFRDATLQLNVLEARQEHRLSGTLSLTDLCCSNTTAD